jgi:acyl-CoA thioester hydrolase
MNRSDQTQRSEFTWPVRVYWEDTDAGGIVFYANYLKYLERARTEWLRSLGIGQRSLRDQTGCMFVVTDTQLRYLHPGRLDDELIVTASLKDLGRASMTIAQEVRLQHGGLSASSGQVLCSGTIRIGWVNAANMNPTRIPSSILKLLT